MSFYYIAILFLFLTGVISVATLVVMGIHKFLNWEQRYEEKKFDIFSTNNEMTRINVVVYAIGFVDLVTVWFVNVLCETKEVKVKLSLNIILFLVLLGIFWTARLLYNNTLKKIRLKSSFRKLKNQKWIKLKAFICIMVATVIMTIALVEILFVFCL